MPISHRILNPLYFNLLSVEPLCRPRRAAEAEKVKFVHRGRDYSSAHKLVLLALNCMIAIPLHIPHSEDQAARARLTCRGHHTNDCVYIYVDVETHQF